LVSVDQKKTPKNLTDLMVASYFGHYSVVKVLVDSGAKINRQDKKGWTALLWAAEEGHLAMIEPGQFSASASPNTDQPHKKHAAKKPKSDSKPRDRENSGSSCCCC
jgi:ankyrin repeat protein